MTDHDESPAASTGLSRRHIAQAVGWSVPLAVAAVGAPAAQASAAPPPAFDGLSGSWGTPVSDYGFTRLDFIVTNTGTKRYRLDALRVEHTSSNNVPRAIIFIAYPGYHSTSQNLEHKTFNKPDYCSVLNLDGYFLELDPAQSERFTVVISGNQERITLTPFPDPDFSKQLSPFSFPTTTVG